MLLEINNEELVSELLKSGDAEEIYPSQAYYKAEVDYWLEEKELKDTELRDLLYSYWSKIDFSSVSEQVEELIERLK